MRKTILRLTRFVAVFCLGLSLTGHASAGRDPKGDSTVTAADIESFSVTGDAGDLRVVIKNAEPYEFANTQIMIDTDMNAFTGHSIVVLGADVMVEGGQAYRFASEDPDAWEWKPIGQVAWEVDGNKLTARVPGKLLVNDPIGVVVRTLDEKYNVLDKVPDKHALLVDLRDAPSKPDAAQPNNKPKEAAGDADDPARDLTDVSLKQDGAHVVIKLKAAAASDFATTLVFFDTDGDADTGYLPGSDPRFGFEMLLNGGTLSRHNAADRGAWTWEALGQVEQSPDGDQITLRFDASLLESESVRVGVWSMSADWQDLIDQAPDRGLYELKLDPTKMTPAAPEPKAVPAGPRANRDLPARERVAKSQSFYCYYGSGRVAALSHYDVVILHDPQMKPTEIAQLNELGVVTIGYISVGEDDQKRTGDGSGPANLASWYFDKDADGQPDRNTIWNSWYANAADPLWRADRVAEARRLVHNVGYDGIFLDTLDTSQIYPDSAEGMVQLIAELREALPDSPIILNQGFKLFHRLAPYADGLMLESFTATYEFHSKRYRLNHPASLDQHTRTAQTVIDPVIAEHPMPVFVLDYAVASDLDVIQTAADRAATFGYQFAAAPIFLDDVYTTGITGQPDPKWLKRQATPELLSVELAEPANGFPAGTRIMPSSCYADYSVAPLVDGIADRSTLHWSRAAWASADEPQPAWLQLDLPQPTAHGQLHITWATDAGVTHTPQNYRVEVRLNPDADWQPATPAESDNPITHTHTLPPQPFTSIRIYQPPAGGSPTRPNLLWIAQIKRTTN